MKENNGGLMKLRGRRGSSGAGKGRPVPGDHPQRPRFGSGFRRRGTWEIPAPKTFLDPGGSLVGDHPEEREGGRG